MRDTKIEWCDHTFNPWLGCTKVHTGCKHCYAEELMDARFQRVEWGNTGTRKLTKSWGEPAKWNDEAAKDGRRFRVFCASLCDVFEDWRKPMDGIRSMAHARRKLFKLIDNTPYLDWLLLTKRPENIVEMWPDDGRWRPNVWLGTSISDQETASAAVRLFSARHLSPVLFLSIEPLIGPVDLHNVGFGNDGDRAVDSADRYALLTGYYSRDSKVWHCHDPLNIRYPSVDWVIVGGESGTKARPCQTDWIRAIRDQCLVNVPVFIKQMGANSDIKDRVSGKGDDPSEWPHDLDRRQFPKSVIYAQETTRKPAYA